MKSVFSMTSKPELLTGDQKKIEQNIVQFFLAVGRKYNRNPKLTEFYAYFRIYRSLTQKQLKHLTGYSASTISTTLQVMLQRRLLTRSFLPNTHTNLYSLTPNYSPFIFGTTIDFAQYLRSYDDYLADLQQRSQNLQSSYPRFLPLFHHRLNGIRNYIEIHCRALTGQKKNDFFDESILGSTAEESYTKYPPEIKLFEDEFVNHFTTTQMFVRDDPIINKILCYLTTRVKLNQESLLKLTGYSRGKISQILSTYGDRGYLSITKKEYRKPRYYSIENMSLYLTTVVVNNYNLILSKKNYFETLFTKLVSEQMDDLLVSLVKEIITDLKTLEHRVALLIQSKLALEQFLGK